VEWLIKCEEDTDPNYGKPPEERSIEELINTAVIIVDKHAGPTSHQVTEWVRKIFGVKKAGHAGTLDPGVTGVLPIALANAVKAMPVLMGLDKEYVGVMHVHKDFDADYLKKIIAENFIGEITQVPPKKSAVKRAARKRMIYFFDILEVEGRDVLFHVKCQAGTYVRKLVADIGLKSSLGAHMTQLRRIKAGPFSEEEAHSLVSIRDAYETWKDTGNEKELRKILLPVELALPHVKKVFIKDTAVDAIANGAPLYPSGIVRIQKGILAGEIVAVMTLKNELVALGIAKMDAEKMFKAEKGVAVRIDRVFMPRGVYPANAFKHKKQS